MAQLYKSGGDPRAMLQTMISSNNPQVAEAMKLISDSGGDIKAAFYNLAARKGADPNSILRMLQ